MNYIDKEHERKLNEAIKQMEKINDDYKKMSLRDKAIIEIEINCFPDYMKNNNFDYVWGRGFLPIENYYFDNDFKTRMKNDKTSNKNQRIVLTILLLKKLYKKCLNSYFIVSNPFLGNKEYTDKMIISYNHVRHMNQIKLLDKLNEQVSISELEKEMIKLLHNEIDNYKE